MFEATGFAVPAAAVAADDLRRGDAPLRLRPPRHPLRPGDARPRRRARGAEFKVFAGALAAGGVVPRASTPAPRELPRSELDALTELAKQHGAKGLVWAFVAGGRRLALADRQVPLRRARSRRSTRRLGRRAGRPAVRSSPTRRRSPAEALGALRLELARRFELIARAAATTCSGWSSSRCSSWDAESSAGTPLHHPVHRARRATSTDPGRAALARLRPRARRRGDRRRLDPHPPPRGPAAGVRADRHRRPRRRRRASASCSTRSSTAPRRTAASRWASTASSRSSPGATRSAR